MAKRLLIISILAVVGLAMIGCYQRTVDSDGIGSDRQAIHESNLPRADDSNQEVFEDIREIDPGR